MPKLTKGMQKKSGSSCGLTAELGNRYISAAAFFLYILHSSFQRFVLVPLFPLVTINLDRPVLVFLRGPASLGPHISVHL